VSNSGFRVEHATADSRQSAKLELSHLQIDNLEVIESLWLRTRHYELEAV